MSIYTVESKEIDGNTVVTARGELDLSVADEVESLLDRVLAQGSAIIDLSRCDYIDSTILTIFVRMTARYDRQFRIVIPPTGAIRRVFEVTGLDKVLLVFADRVTALHVFEVA